MIHKYFLTYKHALDLIKTKIYLTIIYT